MTAAEILTIEMAKAELRITSTSQDDLISGHINAALAWVEKYTRRNWIDKTIPSARADILGANSVRVLIADLKEIPDLLTNTEAGRLIAAGYLTGVLRRSPDECSARIELDTDLPRDFQRAKSTVRAINCEVGAAFIPDQIRQAAVLMLQELYDGSILDHIRMPNAATLLLDEIASREMEP